MSNGEWFNYSIGANEYSEYSVLSVDSKRNGKKTTRVYTFKEPNETPLSNDVLTQITGNDTY